MSLGIVVRTFAVLFGLLSCTAPRVVPTFVPSVALHESDDVSDVSDESDAPVIRVMPLGDSITEGAMVPGGYRTELWRLATLESILVEFVGTRENGPITLPHRRHEGHAGFRIEGIEARVDDWLARESPDVVLLMIGTNDMLAEDRRATAPDRLAHLLDRIVERAPDARVLVASIPPLGPRFGKQIETFNRAIPAIVESRAKAGKKIELVDVRASLDATDLLDEIHPSARGYEKIARAFLPYLQTPVAKTSVPAMKAMHALP